MSHPALYLPDGICYVWLVLEPGDEDLFPALLSPMPKDDHWMWYDVCNEGWEPFLNPPWAGTKGRLGWDWVFTWTQYALEQGIAPGQPFLVWLDKPH